MPNDLKHALIVVLNYLYLLHAGRMPHLPQASFSRVKLAVWRGEIPENWEDWVAA